jgi:hypothetical protein
MPFKTKAGACHKHAFAFIACIDEIYAPDNALQTRNV